MGVLLVLGGVGGGGNLLLGREGGNCQSIDMKTIKVFFFGELSTVSVMLRVGSGVGVCPILIKREGCQLSNEKISPSHRATTPTS